MSVTEYKLATSVQEVEELIAAGWQPQGGVAYTRDGCFRQAMVRQRPDR